MRSHSCVSVTEVERNSGLRPREAVARARVPHGTVEDSYQEEGRHSEEGIAEQQPPLSSAATLACRVASAAPPCLRSFASAAAILAPMVGRLLPYTARSSAQVIRRQFKRAIRECYWHEQLLQERD